MLNTDYFYYFSFSLYISGGQELSCKPLSSLHHAVFLFSINNLQIHKWMKAWILKSEASPATGWASFAKLYHWLSLLWILLPMKELQETWVWSLVGKIPRRRKWQPTPIFLPRKSHGRRSLAGYSPWVAELDMTEWLSNRAWTGWPTQSCACINSVIKNKMLCESYLHSISIPLLICFLQILCAISVKVETH